MAFSTRWHGDGGPCGACAGGETACTVYAAFDSDVSVPDFTAEVALDAPPVRTVELVCDP